VVEPAPTLGPATIAAAGTVIIGRHPSCQVILADDTAVGAHHAVVYPLDDLVAVEDLGSSTGTWFNGQRLRAPAILHVGDQIAIGRHHVRVMDRADEHAWAGAPDAALTA
jgi:pSer/pThr/pTyr-binding forkhead associated (FHA) protein